MKYLLTILAALLASEYAYGADRMGGYTYDNDKAITNDDLQNAAPDKDSSTFNQMPTPQGSEGSAAGGMSKGPDSMSSESGRVDKPVDKTPVEPAKEPDEPYTPGY